MIPPAANDVCELTAWPLTLSAILGNPRKNLGSSEIFTNFRPQSREKESEVKQLNPKRKKNQT
jgi:hypothetical protein